MDMKENLVELLRNMPVPEITVFGQRCGKALVTAEFIANHLIANGVTFATDIIVGDKWIPVTERLPDTQEYDWVLAQITLRPECIYGVPAVAELRADGWYDAYDNMIDGKYEKVTHWMPLPLPPGGE